MVLVLDLGEIFLWVASFSWRLSHAYLDFLLYIMLLFIVFVRSKVNLSP